MSSTAATRGSISSSDYDAEFEESSFRSGVNPSTIGCDSSLSSESHYSISRASMGGASSVSSAGPLHISFEWSLPIWNWLASLPDIDRPLDYEHQEYVTDSSTNASSIDLTLLVPLDPSHQPSQNAESSQENAGDEDTDPLTMGLSETTTSGPETVDSEPHYPGIRPESLDAVLQRQREQIDMAMGRGGEMGADGGRGGRRRRFGFGGRR